MFLRHMNKLTAIKEPLFCECLECGFKGMPRSVACHKCGSENMDIYNLPNKLYPGMVDKKDFIILVYGYVSAAFMKFGNRDISSIDAGTI